MAARILLTRHGETYESRNSIIQGHSDTALTTVGRETALAVGEYLSCHESVKVILTSDLSRTVETARLIASKIDPRPQIIQVFVLREMCSASLEGKPFALLDALRASDPRGEEYAAPVGGESIADLRKRVLDWYYSFIPTAADGTLIVTHKGPLSIILQAIEPPMAPETMSVALDHCTVTILELNDNGRCRFVKVIRPYEETYDRDIDAKRFF